MKPIELVVLSGKGGAGKTSVAASLATVLHEQSVAADCDVDAGNLHLLLHPEQKGEEPFKSGEIAVVDENPCTGCGLCVEHCAFDALHINEKNVAEVHESYCEGCRFCATVCPEKCISMERHYAGTLFSGVSGLMPMVWADLKGGEDNSGKLVAEVKKRARQLAIDESRPFVIIDGPPGIGCPVTSSLSGAGVVLMVMESTVSGFHDVKRVSSLLKHFKLFGLLLLNKADLNQEITAVAKAWAEEEGIPVVGEIPYVSEMRDAVILGKPPVNMGGVLEDIFLNIARKVERFLQERGGK